MKILKIILIALVALIVVIVIAGFTFIRHMSNRAIPDYNENIRIEGLHAPVEVYRDSFAIPHIYATDEHDLYMVTGYLLAEDRLWQMDLLRHVTEGRLSEIFGAGYVQADLLLRALRFRDKSDKILAKADSSNLIALNAFAEGINVFLEKNKNHLPPEFTILRYKPEKWQPYQTLNMIGYMAWDLKAGWSEILLTSIQKTVDSVRYRQILPDLLRNQPTVYPQDKSGTFSSLLPDMMLYTAGLQDLGADVLDASNNWAVSGFKSSTGKPLLANDMHLGLSVPGIWYQIHQVIPGKMNVTGLLLPGAPVVICGHNDSIAWGMTNTYVDNLDFYRETVNPGDTGEYKYMGKWLKFLNKKEVIKISDGTQVEKTIRFSHRGPVVSSIKNFGTDVITMHWVGDEMSDEFKTVLMLDRANNWAEFKDALKTFNSLSQNVAYADVKGNIGLFCAAGIPIRDREIPFGILPGDTDKYDWKGYVPFEELPYMFNPLSGFVASANNRTVPRDYPYHIGSWYSLPDRFSRITEMLTAKEILSVEDFKNIQLDQKSKLAEKYMPAFVDALSGFKPKDEVEKKALEMLKTWNYTMAANSSAPTVFETMYLQLLHGVFSDELGNDLFLSLNGVTSISRNAFDQMMETRVSAWFDDISTPDKTETFTDMVTLAFTKSVGDLRVKMGEDTGLWQWGKIHHLLLQHPLGVKDILDKAFHLNRGPFPVGGSFHTVSPYSYDPNNPYDSKTGSSHRHIFDLSDWDKSLTVIPTGNSGIPSSKHYCDQTDLYVNGRYHADHFTRDNVIKNAQYHMTFSNK
ncbi:MAG TPA: penicillin acylase family protein [Bacteroidales bacterium]|nr:penicillin acylase family protein [Bacteroidales bacterium]